MERIFSALKSLQQALKPGGTLPELLTGISPTGGFWAFSTHPMRTLWALETPLPPGTIEELLKTLPETDDLSLIVLGKEDGFLAVVRDSSESTILSMAALTRHQDGWMLQRAAWQGGKMTSEEERSPVAKDFGTVEALRFLLEKVIQEVRDPGGEEDISPAGVKK